MTEKEKYPRVWRVDNITTVGAVIDIYRAYSEKYPLDIQIKGGADKGKGDFEKKKKSSVKAYRLNPVIVTTASKVYGVPLDTIVKRAAEYNMYVDLDEYKNSLDA